MVSGSIDSARRAAEILAFVTSPSSCARYRWLRVHSVQRVENPALWMQYIAGRTLIMGTPNNKSARPEKVR